MKKSATVHSRASALSVTLLPTATRREGLEEGKLVGKQEGKREGKLEGEAAVLERLLTRRFGPLDEATRNRIRGAGLEQLPAWNSWNAGRIVSSTRRR